MTRASDERTVDARRVRMEHLDTVNEPAHWAYLVGVLLGGTILMLLMIAVLAGGS